MEHQQVLITGGAGFIGSHLSKRLLDRGNTVTVVDNCSTGRDEWVPDQARFVKGDLTDRETVKEVVTEDLDVVYHLAASKAVNSTEPHQQFQSNTTITQHLLNRMNEVGVPEFVFTSSSTVYGEAPYPTPKTHGPLEPISMYGASKLADEGVCSVYAHSHGLDVTIFRFANIVGPRLRGAVIPDFIMKLQDDPSELEILGDGRQEKSYMHVEDCIDAMFTVLADTDQPLTIANLGTHTTTSVTEIADIVCEELGVNPAYEYTGGDRGWTGDVPKMQLQLETLDALGWTPEHESTAAVRKATQELISELSG